MICILREEERYEQQAFQISMWRKIEIIKRIYRVSSEKDYCHSESDFCSFCSKMITTFEYNPEKERKQDNKPILYEVKEN